MRTLNGVLVVALATAALSLPAYAAQESKGGKEWPSFSKADKDGSGMISKEEAGSVQGLEFSKADQNNDGQLSKSEYEAAKKAQGQKTERKEEKERSSR